jgi:hypothetical protein
MSPLTLLTILLIVAKLADWITVSWWIVFAPVILQLTLLVLVVAWLALKA